MRWLHNSNLVSVAELRANYMAANAATKSTEVKLANYYAHYAALYAAHHTAAHTRQAANSLKLIEKNLSNYFYETQENRKAYEEKAKQLNILGATNEKT